jgi:type IV secretion system protein VirB1
VCVQLGPALSRPLSAGNKSMKILLLCAAAIHLGAQTLTPAQFHELGKACIPDSDPLTITALVRTESNFHPYALSLNYPEKLAKRFGYASGRVYLKHQPRTEEEALRWAHELLGKGATLSVGLMQVNTQSRYPIAMLLRPCQNLRIGWEIFQQKYGQAATIAGPGQKALRMAISSYNAGSITLGFQNGYVRTVLEHAAR